MERQLLNLLNESENIRQQDIENESAGFDNDHFLDLSDFIRKKLNNPLFRNQNAKIIANHFDVILPYIVSSNMGILLSYTDILLKQPNFKERFIEGLKKYPYPDGIGDIFNVMYGCIHDEFDEFIDENILNVLSTMDLNNFFYSQMLNRLNEDNQGKFLKILAENKCDIPYNSIEYKGNNEHMMYDNIDLFIENAQNLYSLMNFVKDNPNALSKVKAYIDNNEEKAIDSIFCETEQLVKINDQTLKEIIRLIVLDVMKNENAKLSDITYNGGGLSRVLLVGDKVIKLGERATKSFPNNPYIIAPLLRKELEHNNEKFFIEVTERVDTSTKVSKEELYQLFKNLRDLGLKWTDIKESNVGRLNKENIIHWQGELSPTDEVLSLDDKRGDTILEEGDLVILDADFIYDENDPNIDYSNNKELYKEFEDRYQKEKGIIDNPEIDNTVDSNITEQKGMHR